jgi:hypothetical protein
MYSHADIESHRQQFFSLKPLFKKEKKVSDSELKKKICYRIFCLWI